MALKKEPVTVHGVMKALERLEKAKTNPDSTPEAQMELSSILPTYRLLLAEPVSRRIAVQVRNIEHFLDIVEAPK